MGRVMKDGETGVELKRGILAEAVNHFSLPQPIPAYNAAFVFL
jgi:hypothetical protein